MAKFQDPVSNSAWLGNVVLILISTAFGIIVVEGGYRTLLYVEKPEKFLVPWNRDHPIFGLFNVSHWEFDEEFGFIYPPGRQIDFTGISDGKVDRCQIIETINERGNIGSIRGDYETADLKILVFGDSFPAFSINGWTFPAKLQDTLGAAIGKVPHIVNFGRDGYGVLQILDLAAARIPEWKPDLVIISFTTDDLTRVRIWRTATQVNGEDRILTTIGPEASPPPSRSQDTFVVDERTNNAWCTAALANGGEDPLVEELEFKYRRMAREAGYWFPDPLSLTHSFVAARIVHGDPFDTGRRESFQIPRISMEDYVEDQRFNENLAVLDNLDIPYVIVHLPISTEVKTGDEAILSDKEQRLWHSLETATNKRVHGITEYIDMPLEDADRMNASPTNMHPSPWGMQLYADAITKMLISRGLVSPAIGE